MLASIYGKSMQRESKMTFKDNGDDYRLDDNTSIKSYGVHYCYPQLAKLILDRHNAYYDDLCQRFRVYYLAIDSIIVDTRGKQWLEEQGMIGLELGQFKPEATFLDIAFKSRSKWMARLAEPLMKPQKIWHNDEMVFMHVGNEHAKYADMSYEDWCATIA
jgi:hypothetical protein